MPIETSSSTTALTLLSEEEIMFRDAVAAYAAAALRPPQGETETPRPTDPAPRPRECEAALICSAAPPDSGSPRATLCMPCQAVSEVSLVAASPRRKRSAPRSDLDWL